jgi:hypothetical protein
LIQEKGCGKLWSQVQIRNYNNRIGLEDKLRRNEKKKQRKKQRKSILVIENQ